MKLFLPAVSGFQAGELRDIAFCILLLLTTLSWAQRPLARNGGEDEESRETDHGSVERLQKQLAFQLKETHYLILV